MNLEELKENLKNIGFGNDVDALSEVAKRTIRIYPHAVDEDIIPVGQSKIGGRPDLPPSIKWPTEKGKVAVEINRFPFLVNKDTSEYMRSLSFVAQINLEQIAQLETGHGLPSTGMLYFFYCQDQSAWGFDPMDAEKFRVIYYNADFEELKRAEFPADIDNESKFKVSLTEFRSEINMPSYPHPAYDELDEDKVDKMFELIDGQEMSRLFGYPDLIQNPMELECELVTNGLYCGDGTGYGDPRAKLLAKNTKDWRLLFQLDSNEENGMMWGDCGRLYFWIKEQDLERKQFEHAWCILQCY